MQTRFTRALPNSTVAHILIGAKALQGSRAVTDAADGIWCGNSLDGAV